MCPTSGRARNNIMNVDHGPSFCNRVPHSVCCRVLVRGSSTGSASEDVEPGEPHFSCPVVLATATYNRATPTSFKASVPPRSPQTHVSGVGPGEVRRQSHRSPIDSRSAAIHLPSRDFRLFVGMQQPGHPIRLDRSFVLARDQRHESGSRLRAGRRNGGVVPVGRLVACAGIHQRAILSVDFRHSGTSLRSKLRAPR